jgi:hypothetical protein
MSRTPVKFASACALAVLFGCSSAPQQGTDSTPEAGPDTKPGATADGGSESGSPRSKCEQYLTCVAAVSPTTLGSIRDLFGPDGKCFASGQADECERTCLNAFDGLRDIYGADSVACGATNSSTENPYGAKLPSNGVGSEKGDRIGPISFFGQLRDEAPTARRPIHLVRFYDPDQKLAPSPVKLVHVVGASGWLKMSLDHASAYAAESARLRAKGIVTVVAIIDSPRRGVAATATDLDRWLSSSVVPDALTIDSQLSLGKFFDSSAVPVHLWIDARSMEIMSTSVGTDASPEEESTKLLREWQTRVPLQP